MSLVVAEAVLLHDALDEFVDGEVAEEDGPVVDFGFGGADVDAFGCIGRKAKKESVMAFLIVRATCVMGFGKVEGKGKVDGLFLTWRPARRRGSGALVGRIDVQDLDISRRSVVDEEIMGGTQLDEYGTGAGCLDGGLLLLHGVIDCGTR